MALGLHLVVLLWRGFPVWTFKLLELALVSLKLIAQHFEKLAQFLKNMIFWETYPLVINNLEQMDNHPLLSSRLTWRQKPTGTQVH